MQESCLEKDEAPFSAHNWHNSCITKPVAKIRVPEPLHRRVLERAMYVGFDGHSVTGLSAPSKTRFFAEGSTQNPFHTWLLRSLARSGSCRKARLLTRSTRSSRFSTQGAPVRGGMAEARHFIAGTKAHRGVPGLFGFSVQYSPGKTVRQLAAAGRFPNSMISVTSAERLINAAARVGYSIQIVPSPGQGYHATVSTPFPLPEDLASALSDAFDTMKNPIPYRDVV